MYDERIEVEENQCIDTFIGCTTEEETGRRKRQAASSDRIFVGIEGVEENNRYELNANTGDTSTPRGNIYIYLYHDTEVTTEVATMNITGIL